MKQGRHEQVDVNQVILDKSNPRIKLWLEMYEGEPTPEQIHLALGVGSDDKESQGGTTFNKLKNSILTHCGIIQPILINQSQTGEMICIEGNTRLCLYRSFLEQKVSGNWDKIPSIIYADLTEEEIDAIRLQAHLIGPRQWDAYSKAKYLSYLRNIEKFPFSRLVDYCGGSQKVVMESIDAYADMEMYYRPLCDCESDFDVRRFSGFVELQKNNIKTAILEAGFDLTDFAKWMYGRDPKIAPLNTVRQLSKILRNKTATQVFLKHGAQEAIKTLDRPNLTAALKEASLEQLCDALTDTIINIKFEKVKELRADTGGPVYQALLDAKDALNAFIESIQPNE
ncbi:MAG: hypothetical protein WCL54_08970 [Clostridia bacterium]